MMSELFLDADVGMRAVFFDAFGTLVTLENFFSRVQNQLSRHGVCVSEELAVSCCREEMDFYARYCSEASDRERLRELRWRCAEVLMLAFQRNGVGTDLDLQIFGDILMQSLRFTVFPDVLATLELLKSHRLRLAVVSNWDCELRSVLQQVGIVGYFDGVYPSSLCGYSKPNPAIFAYALRTLDVKAEETIHIGDKWEEDVEGAKNAGIRPVFLQRSGVPCSRDGVPAISSLTELPNLLKW